jgi:N-acyl-L-homoserine lactone synthetase
MMPTYIYRSVFEKPGIEMEYLGPVTMIGRHRIRAVAIPVDHKQLDNVRAKTGIANAVLTFLPAAQEEVLSYDQAA